MSTSSILSGIYFLGMSIHGVIYAGWAAGGVKAQMSYVVLLTLGVLVCYDNLILASGVVLEPSYLLYNLCIFKEYLATFFYPFIAIVLCDMIRFYAQKYSEKKLCRVMNWIPWSMMALASVFSVAHGAYVWSRADLGNFGLVHVKGVTTFKMHGGNWVNYWWDVVFIMIWIKALNIMAVMILLMINHWLTLYISTDLAYFATALFKSLSVMVLLQCLQSQAYRDINDRGYEIHQVQFNTIFRRIPLNN